MWYHSRRERIAVLAAWADVEGLTTVLKQDKVGDFVPIQFVDVTEAMHVGMRHFPADRSSLIPEDMGSGVAWGDFDGDGFTDLFVVNVAGPAVPGAGADREAGRSRLFRNENGKRFVDVTGQSGIDFVGVGMAAAWGDYDGDDDLDLYITAYGDNALFENAGDGTFHNVTNTAGVQDSRFSSGCSWADYDRDGDLDLYVCNYVDFLFREGDRTLPDPKYAEQPYTTNPSSYAPVPNSLFRNRGNGTFEEVAAEAGVADPKGRGLSAAWADLDNDGWQDLYIANDVSWNGVFRNRGDGTFEDIAATSLAADYRSGMGLAIADFDDDLDDDVFITHWIAQENALYRNQLLDETFNQPMGHSLWFVDAADRFGLGQVALDMVGWATGFCDFDNDGRRDLWLVNGHTFERKEGSRRVLIPQPALVFWNRENKGFVEMGAGACPRFAEAFVGRGGAEADFDKDGLVDLCVVAHGVGPILLRNVSPGAGHWTRIVLEQKNGNTRAIGARVLLELGNGRPNGSPTRMGEVGASPSYLSQREFAIHFGLGASESIDELRILWPDGSEESHVGLPADCELRFAHEARYPVPGIAPTGVSEMRGTANSGSSLDP